MSERRDYQPGCVFAKWKREVRESMIILLELQARYVKIQKLVSATLAVANGREYVKPLDQELQLIRDSLNDELSVLGQMLELPPYLRYAEVPYFLLAVEPEVVEVFGGSEALVKILKRTRYDYSGGINMLNVMFMVATQATDINESLLRDHDFLMRTLEENYGGHQAGDKFTLNVADTVRQADRYESLPEDYPGDPAIRSKWSTLSQTIDELHGQLRAL